MYGVLQAGGGSREGRTAPGRRRDARSKPQGVVRLDQGTDEGRTHRGGRERPSGRGEAEETGFGVTGGSGFLDVDLVKVLLPAQMEEQHVEVGNPQNRSDE